MTLELLQPPTEYIKYIKEMRPMPKVDWDAKYWWNVDLCGLALAQRARGASYLTKFLEDFKSEHTVRSVMAHYDSESKQEALMDMKPDFWINR